MTQTPPKPAPVHKPPPRRRGCLFWFAVTVGVLFLLMLLAVLGLWYTYRQATAVPEYWKKQEQLIQNVPVNELTMIGTEAEQRVTETLTRLRGVNGEPTRFELNLSFDQINAWLHTRFPAWAAHQGVKVPSELQGIMVTQEAGALVLATRVQSSAYAGVLSMAFDVRLTEPGANPGLLVKLNSIQSGNIAVPPATVAGLLASSPGADEQARQWLDLLLKGYQFPATIGLDGQSGRKLRIDEFVVTEKGIRAVIEQAPPTNKGTQTQ